MRYIVQARLYVVLAICLCTSAVSVAAPVSQPAALTPGDHRRELAHDGRNRSYLVHVPPKYDPREPTAVVLAFHGAMMNAGMMVGFCGLSEKADEANFVVVYPNGTGLGEAMLFFNASAKPSEVPGKKPPDDVGFTAALLDDLAKVVNVDPKRVFATGMSNGGMMSHRLAAELSDRIAAIAPVAGTLAIAEVKPKRPVPVMHFHGRADAIVPFAGPRGRTPRTMQFLGVDETIAAWLKANGCPADAKVTAVEDREGNMPVIVRRYGPGRQGAEVVLVDIENAGHTWPGRDGIVAFIGRSTKAISANDMMWEFFQRHPMK